MNVKALIAGLVLLIGMFSISMATNNTEIPKAVKEAFSKKYPTAEKVEWDDAESDAAEYEVEFKLKGNKSTAKFKADGSWLETETKIKKSDLPQAVKTAITAQFTGYDLDEVELVETPELAMAYEVKLKDEKNDSEVKAIFSADGKLLSQKVKNGEEENEGEEEENEENEDNDGN